MHRREALQLFGALAASSFAAAIPLDELEAMGVRAHAALADAAAPGPLTARERAILAAAADTILPRTSTPGARDVGAPAFAEHMLERWYPASELEAVRTGLRALDAAARERHGRPFAALGERARLALLEPLDAAQAEAAAAGSPPHWFATLKYLTVWGWATSAPVQREVLGAWPLPGRYDPDARISATPPTRHAHE